MITGSTILSGYGIVAMSLSIYFTLKTLENFWSNEKVSMTAFFLRNEVTDSFKVLTGTVFIFSVSMGLATVGYYNLDNGLSILTQAPTVGSIALFTGFLYFCKTISDVTTDYNPRNRKMLRVK